jgi:hypothetical protein
VNDPQQEIFSELKIRLEAKGYAVHDGFLPPESTPYPFVYMGDSQQIDDENKNAVFGNVIQTIHVWHNNPKRRGDVSQILLDIKQTCRAISHTASFAWSVRNVTQNIIPDTTTSAPLLHGVLEVEWKFS